MEIKPGALFFSIGIFGLAVFAQGCERERYSLSGSTTSARGDTAMEQLRRLYRRPGLGIEAPPVWPPSPLRSTASSLIEQTVEERMKLNRHLLTQDAATLFGMWRTQAQRGEDPLRLDFIANALAVQLVRSEGGDTRTLKDIRNFVEDRSQDMFLRWHLIEMLGEAATPGALQVLLELRRASDPDLEAIVLRQIGRLGNRRPDGAFNEDLSPQLERAWSYAPPDDRAMVAMALSIARIGSPDGVKLLLDTVMRAGISVREFEEKNDPRAWGAFDALADIRNRRSIPILEAAVQSTPSPTMEVVAAARALGAMGIPDATRILLTWAQSSSSDVVPFISEWVLAMRDEESVALVTVAATNSPFANQHNQVALQMSLAEWKAHRSR